MKVRTGIMVNSSQGNTAFSVYTAHDRPDHSSRRHRAVKKIGSELAESNRTHWAIVLTLFFFSEFQKKYRS
jgi:hypothetical protein